MTKAPAIEAVFRTGDEPKIFMQQSPFDAFKSVWQWTAAATDFFNTQIPFWEMSEADNLTPNSTDYVMAKEGEYYVAYMPYGQATNVQLNFNGQGGETFDVFWYNPREGGDLISAGQIDGGSVQQIDAPPEQAGKDWVLFARNSELSGTPSNPTAPPVEPTPIPTPTPNPSQSLVQLALVNAETDQIVAGYEDLGANGTIDLKGLNLSEYSLVAQINPNAPNASAVQSVKFESSLGNRIESVQPYALFGDIAGDFDGQAASTGDYSVKVIAYTGTGGQGQAIASTDLNYTIVDTTGMPTTPATPIRFEAEDMQVTGYRLESGSFASGGKFVGLVGGADNEVGQASLAFSQPAGKYDVLVGYFDENDGAAKLTVEQNQQVIDDWIFNKELGSNIASADTLTTRQVATGLDIEVGDTFTLKGFEQGISSNTDHARIDYIEFVPSALGASGNAIVATNPSLLR